MLIYHGKTGFCGGVENAINLAIECRNNSKKEVYTLGKLIHNEMVINTLEAIGILPAFDINSLNKRDTLIISSHGTTKDNIDKLNAKGVKIIDATCPFVKKIHDTVYEYSNNGYGIIILGDPAHNEVKGIAGWCNDYQIINDEKEIDFSQFDKYLIVCQTTFMRDKYLQVKKNIESLATKLAKIVVFFDSICYTTEERQKEASLIAEMSEMVLVLGDKQSSNTNKLFQLASEKCSQVYLVSNVSDLKSVQIKNITKLGLLSGASTPKELITEVFNIMSEEKSNGTIEIEDVTTTNEPVKVTEEAQTEVKKEKKEFSMADAMKKYGPKTYREGMRFKATIVSADLNGISVSVDFSGKNDSGFINKDEIELDGNYIPENYKSGDEIDVVVIPKDPNDKNKSLNLSKKAYDAIKIDDEKVKDILAGDEFTLACTQEIKGGLLGKIGTYTVFVPASQIKSGFVQNLADYVGKPLRLKALPPKDELDEEGKPKHARNPKRIVASQRIIIEEEKALREDEFWNSIPVGSVVNGKVKRFASFGAFVSLKYMDALVHNSELSWGKKRINSPDEVLELNKNYEFVVLNIDRENGKISLGYKQLQPKPYDLALTKYPVGSIVKGKVVRIVKFGAFVELEPGIDGLVHISQITRGWTKNAGETLKEGDEVDVKVISFENDKITLSIKELLPEEEFVMPEILPAEEETVSEQTEQSQQPQQEKPSRLAQFNKRMEALDRTTDRRDRKSRRDRDEDRDEPREYISGSSVATLADLFNKKNLD